MADAPAGSELLASRGGILLAMHSLSQGGGDRNGVVLAGGFAHAGIPTRIAVMRGAGEAEGELRSLLGKQVEIATAGSPMSFPLQPQLERLRGLAFLRRQIDAFRPAVVLSVTDNMALITALAHRRGADHPLFAQKLTNRLFRPTIGPGRRFYRYNLFKFIFSRIDLVLTLAEAERRDVLGLYPEMRERVRTVPNPHVTQDMLPAPPPRRPGPPRLLTAGRMVPQKRFDVLLRAFAAIRHSEARLTILGDGPLRPDLAALARTLGIADRVEMPGFDSEIIPWIRQSDLVVMSSDYEGLPGVLIRALACNVPVVTTDSFLAARDLLGAAQSCAIVPTGEPQPLAQAIDRCLASEANEDLRRLVEPYAVEASIAAHIATLAQAVKERTAAKVLS